MIYREWNAQQNIACQSVDLVAFERRDGAVFVAEAFVARHRKVEQGEAIVPSLRVPIDEAQRLLQALWNAGLRPNNGEGTDAQVEAIKAHLADMRKLAFAKALPPIVLPSSEMKL